MAKQEFKKGEKSPNAVDCYNDKQMVDLGLRQPLLIKEKKVKMSDKDRAELATAVHRYKKNITK